MYHDPTDQAPAALTVPAPPAGVDLIRDRHSELVLQMITGRGAGNALTAENLAARNALLSAYEPWVRGVAARLARMVTPDQHTVEEAIAESLYRCTARLPEYDPRGGVPLGAWLITARIVSENLPVAAQPRNHASLNQPVYDDGVTIAGDLLVSTAQHPDEVTETLDPLLALLVETLTAEQQAVVNLKIGADGRPPLTSREIAELLGVSVDAVERRWQRAIRTIRRALRATDARTPRTATAILAGVAA